MGARPTEGSGLLVITVDGEGVWGFQEAEAQRGWGAQGDWGFPGSQIITGPRGAGTPRANPPLIGTCDREHEVKDGAVSGITLGLTARLWLEQCATCWHGPRMPLLSGGLGRDAFSRLALLVVGPGGEWRGGQMPRQLHRVAVPPSELLWPPAPPVPALPTLPCPALASPSARAHLPTCSFHQRVPRRLPWATRFLSHSLSKAPELLTPSLLMAGSYEHRCDLPRIWLVTALRAPVLCSLSPLPLPAQSLYCAAPRFSSWRLQASTGVSRRARTRMEVLCAV